MSEQLRNIEDAVDEWHSQPPEDKRTLHEYLGMPPERYAAWVEELMSAEELAGFGFTGKGVPDAVSLIDRLADELLALRANNRRLVTSLGEALKRRGNVRFLTETEAVQEAERRAALAEAQAGAVVLALDMLWREYSNMVFRLDQGYSCSVADEVSAALENRTGRQFLTALRCYRALATLIDEYDHRGLLPPDLLKRVADVKNGRYEGWAL